MFESAQTVISVINTLTPANDDNIFESTPDLDSSHELQFPVTNVQKIHMNIQQFSSRTIAIESSVMVVAFMSSTALAHCDSMSGPIVKDAQAALASKEVGPVPKGVSDDNQCKTQALRSPSLY